MDKDDALARLRWQKDNGVERDAAQWALDRIAQIEQRIAEKDAALDAIVRLLPGGQPTTALLTAKEGRAK